MNQLQGLREYQSIYDVGHIDMASPERLVQMLLDGTLTRIQAAKGHMMREEFALKGEMIGKAISIVEGLKNSLNSSAGEIAVNLDGLYDYIERRLVTGNLQNDVDALDEAERLIREIKLAWEAVSDVPSEAVGD